MVIVDHGSRRAESNTMLYEFADLYRCAPLTVWWQIIAEGVRQIIHYDCVMKVRGRAIECS